MQLKSLIKLHLILKISLENIKICRECNQQLENTNALVKKAKQLERLFNGLKEENDPDLTITRINAYREHFNLDPIIIAEIEIEIATADDKVETEENLESLEEESIVIESLEESLIIEDEFEVEEEVYIELEEECQISEDSPNAEVDNPLQKISALRLRKTENEKLFNFRCHICSDQEFENMRLLGKHCKESHNCLPKVKCCSDDCSAVLHTWRRLMIHKEKHFPNDDQIKCPECQQVFVTTVGLEKHMKKHLTALICSKCGKKSKDPKSLRWHEAMHEKSLEERQKYDCPYPNCGVKFITKQAQQDHIAARHEKVISCYCDYPNCDRGFYTKKAYHEHVKNAHSERTLRCDHCNFKARTKTALKNHNAVHSVGDLYQCDICNASFAAYRRLKAHMSKIQLYHLLRYKS